MRRLKVIRPISPIGPTIGCIGHMIGCIARIQGHSYRVNGRDMLGAIEVLKVDVVALARVVVEKTENRRSALAVVNAERCIIGC